MRIPKCPIRIFRGVRAPSVPNSFRPDDEERHSSCGIFRQGALTLGDLIAAPDQPIFDHGWRGCEKPREQKLAASPPSGPPAAPPSTRSPLTSHPYSFAFRFTFTHGRSAGLGQKKTPGLEDRALNHMELGSTCGFGGRACEHG